MNAVDGIIIILPSRAEGPALWLKVADGHVVSRSEAAATAGLHVDDGPMPPVMLVIPQPAVTVREVVLPENMPAAQARAAALRLSTEKAMAAPADLHVVPFARAEGAAPDLVETAAIARSDVAHFIAWGRHHGVEADIVIPAGAIIPPRQEGTVEARIGEARLVRGRGLAADASEPWVAAIAGEDRVARLDDAEVERLLIAALADPPVNLRSGEFARARGAALDAAALKRMALWTGFIALATLMISLALIARYHWSAASLDRQTVEAARPLLPAADDAKRVAEDIDRMVAERGGGYAFTGPAAGLLTAMQGVPAVSLSSLGLGDDGLLHATLASARADDINKVLLDVQAAGYTITATSSADPGGRVVAQITVKP